MCGAGKFKVPNSPTSPKNTECFMPDSGTSAVKQPHNKLSAYSSLTIFRPFRRFKCHKTEAHTSLSDCGRAIQREGQVVCDGQDRGLSSRLWWWNEMALQL